MAKEKDSFYVRINSPTEIRKHLLESSKDIISVLKNFEVIEEVRQEKFKKINELQKTMSELRKLGSILNSKVPADKIKSKISSAGKSNAKSSRLANKTQSGSNRTTDKSRASNSEVQKLEEELAAIEQKLNSMGI